MANRYYNDRQSYGRDNRDYRDRERSNDPAFVGRDFETNQHEYRRYGQMDDRWGDYDRQDFGRGDSSRQSFNRYNEYSEPNRDFSERGGGYGSNYGSYYGRDFDRERGSRSFESGRTDFDESISGRPYYGSGYSSQGGRFGSGSDWRSSGRDYGRTGRSYGSGYGSRYQGQRQYGATDWGQGRSDYGRTSLTTGDYDRDYNRDRDDESFGDKVKNFFGMGPKGWKRSDESIKNDVSERLEEHPEINASDVEVIVTEGEVTLTGFVTDRRQKRLAEDVAEDSRGVKDVHNQLRVRSQASTFTGTTSGKTVGSTGTESTRTGKDKERAA